MQNSNAIRPTPKNKLVIAIGIVETVHLVEYTQEQISTACTYILRTRSTQLQINPCNN